VPWPLEGCVYDGDGGDDVRNGTVTPHWFDAGVASGSGAIAVRGGVTDGAGLYVTPGTGMTVDVAPGSFVVPNTASGIAGGYQATLASSGVLTIEAADPSNPRIDIIVAQVIDNGNSTSSGAVAYVEGTAAASPSVPSAPANSIVLAHIAVPAAATSIISGDITDERPFTAGPGGIMKANRGTVTGYQGGYAYDEPSDSLYHNAGAGPRQTRLLPFAPVMAFWTSDISINPSDPGPPTTMASITVTMDGQTDLKITYHVPGLEQPSAPATQQVNWFVLIDGVQLDETDVQLYSIDPASISGHGFTGIAYTASSASTTPDAGSHTVELQAQLSLESGNVNAVASAGRHGYLRVEPVNL
jgi:hypothetical protein